MDLCLLLESCFTCPFSTLFQYEVRQPNHNCLFLQMVLKAAHPSFSALLFSMILPDSQAGHMLAEVLLLQHQSRSHACRDLTLQHQAISQEDARCACIRRDPHRVQDRADRAAVIVPLHVVAAVRPLQALQPQHSCFALDNPRNI